MKGIHNPRLVQPITSYNVNDIEMKGIHNSPTYTYQRLLDADALKMQGIYNSNIRLPIKS